MPVGGAGVGQGWGRGGVRERLHEWVAVDTHQEVTSSRHSAAFC